MMKNRLNLPSKDDMKRVLRFDQKKLPSFPQAAMKLLDASRDGTASLKDISKIVETDPGISVKVLKIVNSALYGLRRKITTLPDAVVILGLDEVKKLAIGMTIFENMFKKGSNQQFDRLLFWRHSLAVAVLSEQIAKEIGLLAPEEAYIAGLLHDIGKIFLDIQGKKNYGDFINDLSISTELVIEKERDFIGLGHDDIGAYFCSLWKLPEKFVIAVKYHHQPFDHQNFTKEEVLLISIVALADFLCWTQGIGSFDFIRPPVLSPEVERTIDLDSIDIIKCILQMNKEMERISEFYHFVFPSVSQLRENLLWANLKLSNATTRYYYRKDPLTDLQDTTNTMEGNSFSNMDLEFAKPLAKANSIKEVLKIIMYQIGRIFQPLHWSILLKEPKTGDMVFSVVVGANKEKLQGTKLPRGEGIAGHIMTTGQSLIIKDVSKEKKFSTRVDRNTGFTTQSIIGTPLKTDDKTFGVIELINRVSDDSFSDKDLELLSSIAEYDAIAIERSYYNQALTNLATRDSLTGLKNKWSFEHTVSNKNVFQKKYGSIFSMLIIKLDGVSQINKVKVQAESDTLYKNITQILSKTKRRGDNLFRYGEDIFIMLLPLTYSEDSKTLKRRINQTFSMAISKEKLPAIAISIMSYTLGSGDSALLKSIVGKILSKSKEPLNKDMITDIEDSLQPLLEQERDKIEKNKTFGKKVSLGGSYIRLKTGASGSIRVEKISLVAIGFRILKSNRIKVNDFLDIQFVLDDITKHLIKRRVAIREINGDYFEADFYNPPPYAKNLGFYLIN